MRTFAVARTVGLLGLLFIAGASVAAGLSADDANVAAAAADVPATIVFVDVDQGDGVVMKIGGKVIVSDAGEHRVVAVNAALERLGAQHIDVAILSHPHDDHVKNFRALFARWEVREAVLSRSAYWQGTKTNKDVIAAISDEGLQPTFLHAGQIKMWGGARWQILNPPDGAFTGGKSQAPNASLAYLLSVRGRRLLFTGDVEQHVAKQLAQRLPAGRARVDVLLATHHGSKLSVSRDLLTTARPRWAVLSVGPNSFHHPSPETVDELKAVGASIWCTDANGDVTARISAAGRLTWSASGATERPWWSATAMRHNGTCVDQP